MAGWIVGQCLGPVMSNGPTKDDDLYRKKEEKKHE